MGVYKFKKDNKQVFIPNLVSFFVSLVVLVLCSIPAYKSGVGFLTILLVAWVVFCFFLVCYTHYFSDTYGIDAKTYNLEESNKKELMFYILKPQLMINSSLRFHPTDVLIRPLISPYYFFNPYNFIPLLITIFVCQFIRMSSYSVYGDFYWNASYDELIIYAFLAQAVVLYAFNLIAIAKAFLSKNISKEQADSYANTKKAEYVMLNLINEADFDYITNKHGLNKQFRLFVSKTYETIRKLNNVVSNYPQYASAFIANSDFLQYIVNDLVLMKTQPVIQLNLSDCESQEQENARMVVKNRIGYDLSQQIKLLDAEVDKINSKLDEVVESIKKDQKDKFLDGLENTVTVNPLSYFPDFYTLEFKELENEVFAKNILNKTLPKLIKARESLTDNDDIAKINKQIDDVKCFVRSIASNSLESKQRALRHSQEQSSDILNIGFDDDYMTDLDYLIGSTSRYLESADKSLPLSK